MKHIFTFSLLMIFSLSARAQGTTVEYKNGETTLSGYYAKAKTDRKKVPGIVIIHQWMGLGAHEKASADKLAALGYHALAADIYGVGHMPANGDEAAKEAGMYKEDYVLFQSRIEAAINELVKLGADPEQIVVIGYCFGGTGALEAARGGLNVKGVVSFHGGLKKDAVRTNTPITTKVLVLHGADDPYVSAEDITNFQKELREGNADWQMIYYANAVHAFTQPEAGNDNSKGAAYNKKAADRSWEHLLVFLEEVVKK